MDGNNTRTSVVIKLPDQEEPDGVNMYKIDLEDVEASKEYVIDQLFSDDDVAVYAVFEASDVPDGKTELNCMTVSCSDFNEFRFSQRKCFTKRKDERIWPGKVPFTDSEGEACLETRLDILDYSQACEMSDREENSPYAGETRKCVKLKSTSKGVNTDITQSPKLLEEMREVVSLNFSKLNDEELASVLSVKSSHHVKEMMTLVSSTASGWDGENGKREKKSAPNIVIVPVLIKDEELCSYWRDDRNKQLSDETRTFETVSVGTNTEVLLLEDRGMVQNKPENIEKSYESEKNGKSQENLLEEIKNLQEKLHTLLKLLESTGFTFAEKTETKDTKTGPEEVEPVQKRLNKFDDIPIFSPETYIASEPKNSSEKTKNNDIEEEMPPIASRQGSSTKYVTNDGVVTGDRCDGLEETTSPRKEKENLICGEFFNWKEVEYYRGPQLSKSQTNNHFVRSKSTNLKKSLSADLAGEALGLRKLENIFFKLEGSVKKENTAVTQNEELILVDKVKEIKTQQSSGLENVGVETKLNYCAIKTSAGGLPKTKKGKINKNLEVDKIEKPPTPSRLSTRTSSIDSGDVKDAKLIKKTGLRSKPSEKIDIKTVLPFEGKQKPILRTSVKDSPQSKLHVDLLIKNYQNNEQKNNIARHNPTRLPRSVCPKKEQKTTKKEKKLEVEPFLASEVSIKSLESEEIRNKAEDPGEVQSMTSAVLLELFSKKPSSMEDFYSEVDLQCLYSEIDSKGNRGSGKSNGSNENPIVNSVWALTKVLLYEDGTKKMEVLEASLHPPDYCFNQNLTEDKIR